MKIYYVGLKFYPRRIFRKKSVKLLNKLCSNINISNDAILQGWYTSQE